MVHLKSQPTEISFWLSSQPLGSYHISSGHCTRIHHRCCKHIRDIIISRKPPNWHQHRQHHWNQDNCAHSTMPSKEITCMNNRRVTGRPCGKKRPYRNLKKRKLKLSMHFLHFFVESSLLIFTFHDIAEYPWASDKQTLPKALRTQALTALTSKFSLVGSVLQVWFGKFGLVSLVW